MKNAASNPKQDLAGAALRLPLVVDLDALLARSSLGWEALALFLRTQFLQVWRLPAWLLAGSNTLRRNLLRWAIPSAASLPYDRQVLAFLSAQQAQGRTLVLMTADGHGIGADTARHLGLFGQVRLADDGVAQDARGRAHQLVGLYGEHGFDYLGASKADRAIWQHSCIALSATARPVRIGDGRVTEQIVHVPAQPGAALIKAMRPRQWLKNLLVFVPMLAGNEITLAAAWQSALAFVAFSLCASSAYLLNDTLDANDDRLHPTKRHRPIAAGSLPTSVALCASPFLAAGALTLSLAAGPILALAVLAYFVSTTCYSLCLKRILMVDIVALAVLYSMRILAGCAATAIEPSFWLLAFSFFFFLSLALLKRHSELHNLELLGKEKSAGRGYTTADKQPIGIMGINSAFVSVLVFILYFESQNALIRYQSPAWLAGTVPLLVFWLGRLWTLSYRGQVNEDPVLYVSRDRVSLVICALCLALALAATYAPWPGGGFTLDLFGTRYFGAPVATAPLMPS
ncbi:UbiA family prenyltransferase [Massilia sp.]|uniref:UbiA family prenyltransferase n=1 Tax=Massilia sp. TaxID=1882437 RepID=UPI00289C6441|nr:UbiA family prenyltransferase [Massilia sp.]